MLRRVGIRWLAGVFVALVLLAAWPVNATTYGEGPYGNCQFGGCTTAVTTTAGLEVSVNLANGQTIPQTGYTIIVTPLNGEGKTFKLVAFYIDGTLQQTVTPDQDGTARWFWDTNGLSQQVTVKIVITDADGRETVKEFVVNIQGDTVPLVEQLTGIPEPLRRALHALPAPVVYAFPYILLALLTLQIAMLLLQTKRELGEYRTLLALLKRHRNNDDAKHTFMQLASHHLRTPLTVLCGGVDLLRESHLPNWASIQASTEKMRSSVELLIGQTEAGQQAGRGLQPQGPVDARPWRHPGLFVPVLLIGASAFIFTYLTANAGGFTISQVNLAVQIIGYIILALLVYQAFRWRQLKRRDRQHLQQIIDEETDSILERDNLIAGTSNALSQELLSFSAMIANLPPGQALELISEGKTRLQSVINKFNTALRLRNARSSDTPKPVAVSIMLAAVAPRLSQAAQDRKMSLNQTSDATVLVQDPKLLTQVIWDLLDNAVAYGREASGVEVTASIQDGVATISVINQGVDIPPPKQSLLFQPFFKAEGAEVVTHEGMGFSLYLDRLIMTYLGGGISLDSHSGRTTVTLKLPVAMSA